MKKGDVLIIVLVLLLTGVFFALKLLQQPGAKVHITVNGKQTTYSLSEDHVVELNSINQGQNVVVIKNHEVYMESADCPDKICVRHKAVSKNGESIICLPNEVFVEIESSSKKETDN